MKGRRKKEEIFALSRLFISEVLIYAGLRATEENPKFL